MNQLQARGLSGGDAKQAAADAAEDAVHDVRNDYLKALEGVDEVRRKELPNARSEVFSTSSLTRQVHGSIGQATEAQRQTEEIVKIRSEFARLADRPGLIIGVRN